MRLRRIIAIHIQPGDGCNTHSQGHLQIGLGCRTDYFTCSVTTNDLAAFGVTALTVTEYVPAGVPCGFCTTPPPPPPPPPQPKRAASRRSAVRPNAHLGFFAWATRRSLIAAEAAASNPSTGNNGLYGRLPPVTSSIAVERAVVLMVMVIEVVPPGIAA